MTNSLMDAPTELMISAYGKQTYNFVPPLMLQERFDASACEGFASDTAKVFTSQGTRKCEGYKCTGAEQRAIQCSSKANADAKSVPAPYFGRESQKYRDEYVFAEFLHTFSSKLIFRSDESGERRPLSLKDYINARTKQLSLVALSFTPRQNIATKLEVQFDFEYPQPQASYKTEHFTGVTGREITKTIVFDVSIVVLAIFIIVGVVTDRYSARAKQRRERLDREAEALGLRAQRERSHKYKTILLSFVLELSLLSTCIAFAIIHLDRALKSNNRLTETFGKALAVPWASNTVSYEEKVSAYFVALNEIENVFLGEQTMSTVYAILMMVLLVRLILYMSVHPRINFIQATVTEAGDDILHFLIAFSVVFMTQAVLATAIFGSKTHSYSTISSTLTTQFR